MILDAHIHIRNTDTKPEPFLERLNEAGIDGGVIFSAFPGSFMRDASPDEDRLAHVLEFCSKGKMLFPFYFLDPLDNTALHQVDRAIEDGIAGFKVICNTFYPGDARCMEVFNYIASRNKPITFHSGILWDGRNASSKFNRPIEFEPLFSIQQLRFALAHISWPWCDECIAVYGKLDNVLKTESSTGGMYVDNTPGTPKLYRVEALTKLIKSGYNVLRNVYFGSDNFAENYDVNWAKDWINYDGEIYSKLGLTDKEIHSVFAQNLIDFIAG